MGEDLFYEHTLSLSEVLCGFKFVIAHLDGRRLLIKSNPGEVVKPGTEGRILFVICWYAHIILLETGLLYATFTSKINLDLYFFMRDLDIAEERRTQSGTYFVTCREYRRDSLQGGS
ncbi:hypothetical protein Droror1_Dr00012291 [Drosera rotundifolia]